MSIIIPACNSAATLAECLAACLAQDYPHTEVIVVDDGSTDSTADIARATSGVRLVQQANQGPAAARNHGARAAQAEILAYTDSDCVPRPDWIGALVASFDEGVVAVGGTYAMANGASRLARIVHTEIAVRHAQFADEVDFLGSFNVACRKEAFDAVGGFEEGYRAASGEDNDLAYRLQDRGGRLRFTSDAVVAHYHPERLWPYLRTQAKHGFWRVKLYRDHPRRARGGDQYAGWPDLIAPPLSLFVLASFPLALAARFLTPWGGWGSVVAGALLLVYLLIHAPMALRLRHQLSTPDLLYCWAVRCIRDLARALGLLRGLWAFRRNGHGAT